MNSFQNLGWTWGTLLTAAREHLTPEMAQQIGLFIPHHCGAKAEEDTPVSPYDAAHLFVVSLMPGTATEALAAAEAIELSGALITPIGDGPQVSLTSTAVLSHPLLGPWIGQTLVDTLAKIMAGGAHGTLGILGAPRVYGPVLEEAAGVISAIIPMDFELGGSTASVVAQYGTPQAAAVITTAHIRGESLIQFARAANPQSQAQEAADDADAAALAADTTSPALPQEQNK